MKTSKIYLISVLMQLDENQAYEKDPKAILVRRARMLRSKEIASMKVL